MLRSQAWNLVVWDSQKLGLVRSGIRQNSPSGIRQNFPSGRNSGESHYPKIMMQQGLAMAMAC